jgi:hypothetical protein
MSTYDGNDLFGSGPHSIKAGSWTRSQQRRGFAGVSGELVIDHGRRSRLLIHAGRLQAASPTHLESLIDAIEAYQDGYAYSLVDNHGRHYTNVLLEQFEMATPVRLGRAAWCDYTITYRQLP